MNLFTENEALEMMYLNTSKSLNLIATNSKKENKSAQEIIDFLIKAADELEAQAVVVKLRDDIKKY